MLQEMLIMDMSYRFIRNGQPIQSAEIEGSRSSRVIVDINPSVSNDVSAANIKQQFGLTETKVLQIAAVCNLISDIMPETIEASLDIA
jgi:hypothetical protein